MVDLTENWSTQFFFPHNNMLWLWMRLGLVGFVVFWVLLGASVLLIMGCVRIGAVRLRMLLRANVAPPRELSENSPENANAPYVDRSMGLVRVVQHDGYNTTWKPAEAPSHLAARLRRLQMREAAELLVLALMGLATIVSLVALTVVDQGLMSYRLMAFAGVLMGAITALWNAHAQKIKLTAGAEINDLPEHEGSDVRGKPSTRPVRMVGSL
jgi:hypothetical protein